MDGQTFNLFYGYVFTSMYLPNRSAQAGCDKGKYLKRSLTGLNSEFSFSKTGCHTEVK